MKATIIGILNNPKAFLKRTMNLYRTDRKYRQLEETFIKQEYGWLYRAIQPNTTLIDLGADIGDMAIFFATNPNVKRVMAYEMLPQNARIARELIEKSPYKKKIHLFNRAVSNSNETIRISKDIGATNGTSLEEAVAGEGFVSKTATLNSILKGLKKVAIKCDIEGMETKIFVGANLNEVYAIMLETHDYKHNLILTQLKAKGFKAQLYRKPIGGNALVVARRN